jgi:hypothetical protein
MMETFSSPCIPFRIKHFRPFVTDLPSRERLRAEDAKRGRVHLAGRGTEVRNEHEARKPHRPHSPYHPTRAAAFSRNKDPWRRERRRVARRRGPPAPRRGGWRVAERSGSCLGSGADRRSEERGPGTMPQKSDRTFRKIPILLTVPFENGCLSNKCRWQPPFPPGHGLPAGRTFVTRRALDGFSEFSESRGGRSPGTGRDGTGRGVSRSAARRGLRTERA